MQFKISLFFILNFIFSNIAFSNETDNKLLKVQPDEVIQVINDEIGTNNTCLDEYLIREKHLGRWLIWTPPVGVIATPASFFAGAYAGLYIAGGLGWDALGGVILGGFFSFTASALTTVGVTTVSAVKFYNNRQMLKLVVDSHQNDEKYGFKTLKKFHKKYRKAWPSDEAVDLATFKEAIKNYDEQGALCNGSIRGTDMDYKLKYRIVRKWDLFNQIHSDYGTQLN